MIATARVVLWWLIDHTFPLAEPETEEEQQAGNKRRTEQARAWDDRTADLPDDRQTLAEYLASCREALAAEDKRREGVDARLTTIVGLSSIAGTIVFGTILANNPPAKGAWYWLIIIVLVYLTLQLSSALLAGIKGLERRYYDAISTTDLLPANNEPPAHHLRWHLRESFRILAQHQDENNKKVTQMAVAHCAMKNFVRALLVLAAIASAYRLTTPRTDDLIDRLKRDHELRDLLTGPQGNQGPSGPPGSPCPAPPMSPAATSPNQPQKQPADAPR